MSLYTQLQQAGSEEDLKNAYTKAVGLEAYTEGLIDIQTKEICFEAKDTGKCSSYAMKARNTSGDTVPVNFGPFEAAYQALSDKLRPQVFSLGFLR